MFVYIVHTFMTHKNNQFGAKIHVSTRKNATLKCLKHDKAVESCVVVYRGLVAMVVTLR